MSVLPSWIAIVNTLVSLLILYVASIQPLHQAGPNTSSNHSVNILTASFMNHKSLFIEHEINSLANALMTHLSLVKVMIQMIFSD